MKKLFAIVLTLALVLALGTTVFAETLNAVGSTNAQNVTATVAQAQAAAEVISVDVQWGTLSFTYTPTEEWNPGTHTTTTTGAWSNAFQNVATVKNHSNAALTASIAFTATENTTYAAAFQANGTDGNQANLATAVDTQVAAAPSVIFSMKVSGAGVSGAAPTNNAVLGTITITIAAQ